MGLKGIMSSNIECLAFRVFSKRFQEWIKIYSYLYLTKGVVLNARNRKIPEKTSDFRFSIKGAVSPPERCDFTSSQQYNNNVL